MKILASSLARAVETFLHAGYISAHPRPYHGRFLGGSEIKVEVDVVQALRLEGETITGALSVPDGAAVAAGTWGWEVVVAAAGVAGAVGLLTLARRRLAGVPTLLGKAGPVFVALIALALAGWSKGPAPPKKAPGYADPQMATRVLLHGIVADALAHAPHYKVRSLKQMRRHVSLPARKLTRGMKHALKSFTRDGWGRPFQLTGSRGKGAYLVRSAGKDGVFKTADDLTRRVLTLRDRNWDRYIRTIYLRKADKRYVFLYHRWRGKLFKYRDKDGARRLTGTTRYDLLPVRTLYDGKHRSRFKAIHARYAKGGKHEPLVLLVIKRKYG